MEGSFAQTITLSEATIRTQTTESFTNVAYGSTTGNGDLSGSSSSNSFTVSTVGTAGAVTTDKVQYKGNKVGGLTLGATAYNTLSTTALKFFTGVVIVGGTITMDYMVTTANNTWNAGTYTTTFFVTPATNITPPSQALNLVVPSFITMNVLAPATTTMTATLAAYRTGGGLTANNTFSYYTTLPTIVNVKAGSANFSFSTTTPKIADPVSSASNLKATLTLPAASIGTAANLSTTDQQITTNAGIPVTTTNLSSTTTALSITPTALKTNFVQAGTYTLPITYTLSKTSAAFGTTVTGTTTSSVQVVVPRLFEFIVPADNVLMNVNTIALYQNGITVPLPNPLQISSTIPYNITVKSSGDFSNGSGGTILANTVTVEGTAAQTGITSVELTTNASGATLVTGAAPVIDRSINLQYRIPAAKTVNLLGKAAGVYQTTITYTCTAP